jgi:hypothetical protein
MGAAPSFAFEIVARLELGAVGAALGAWAIGGFTGAARGRRRPRLLPGRRPDGQLADIGRVASTGYHLPVTTTVKCTYCGAVYETEAPVAAIREVSRCQECGVTALSIVEEERSSDGRDAGERARERNSLERGR